MNDQTSEYQQQFILLKLSSEYEAFRSTAELVDRAASFYVTGIAILVSVAVALLTGLWSTSVTNYVTNLVSLSVLCAIGSGFGIITMRRLIQQRLTMVGNLKKIRVLERYFTARYPAVKPYLIEHFDRRLEQSNLVNIFFSGHATSMLRLFALWNSLLFGMASATTVYTMLRVFLNPFSKIYISASTGIVCLLLLFIVNLRTLKQVRESAQGWGAYEHALAQADQDEKATVHTQIETQPGNLSSQQTLPTVDSPKARVKSSKGEVKPK